MVEIGKNDKSLAFGSFCMINVEMLLPCGGGGDLM
jgi:hypothetical protein